MDARKDKKHLSDGQKKLILAILALAALAVVGLALEVVRAYLVA